jgi:hypothetical protein
MPLVSIVVHAHTWPSYGLAGLCFSAGPELPLQATPFMPVFLLRFVFRVARGPHSLKQAKLIRVARQSPSVTPQSYFSQPPQHHQYGYSQSSAIPGSEDTDLYFDYTQTQNSPPQPVVTPYNYNVSDASVSRFMDVDSKQQVIEAKPDVNGHAQVTALSSQSAPSKG